MPVTLNTSTYCSNNRTAIRAAEAAGKPLHRGRIGRYVQDLTRAQIEEFEQIAESELSRLGYLSAPRLSGDA
ncbi:hypothetical protein ABIF07_003410 [Bradyrhizobium elkanii]|uniref:hypothetical protein n=1 Tax=Bradyrhizobium elkanii TaxID=29448 RepID=UPI003515B00A